MSGDRIVILERPAVLSIKSGRLVVQCGDRPPCEVPVCDVAALIIANPVVSLSSAVLKELAENGAVTVGMGDNYMPVSLTVPLNNNLAGGRRPHRQAKLIGTAAEKKAWNQIIKAKICGQASVIAEYDLVTAKTLTIRAKKIALGDETNCEGAAAKIYWEAFFRQFDGHIATREKMGASDVVNSALNYAYAIVRAIVGRSLCAGGYCLNFGVGHCRKDNPCNLAEDFMEVLRFVAEKAVLQNLQGELPLELTSELKRKLVNAILDEEIRLDKKTFRLFQAADEIVASYGRFLDDPRRRLKLPNRIYGRR